MGWYKEKLCRRAEQKISFISLVEKFGVNVKAYYKLKLIDLNLEELKEDIVNIVLIDDEYKIETKYDIFIISNFDEY